MPNEGKEFVGMKFDTDLILDSFKPLEELEEMQKKAMNIEITKKLEQIVNLLRHTEKGQETPEDLTIKQKNFKLVTDLQNNYRGGEGLTKEDMMKMSKEEFEKKFVELAEYRREAHVISARYVQMLRMIDDGQLPYYIPYANIPSQRYVDLNQYRDRAQRLGVGAADWGREIDVQAQMFQDVYKNEKAHGEIDDIDGLWEDGKGQAAPPPFMRAKKSAEKRLMHARRQGVDRFKFSFKDTEGRSQEIIATVPKGRGGGEDVARKKALGMAIDRTGHDLVEADMGKGKKLKPSKARTAKVWAREFIAVPKGEIRPGEEVRMPPDQQVEGAAAYLLRTHRDTFAWMGDREWVKIRDKQRSVRMGPKDALVHIYFDEVSDEDIDERREHRWTQRGLAPHRGARSMRPGGHEEEEKREIKPGKVRASKSPEEEERALEEEDEDDRIEISPEDTEEPKKPKDADAGAGMPRKAIQDFHNDLQDNVAAIVGEHASEGMDKIWIDPKGMPDGWDSADPLAYFNEDNIKEIKLLENLTLHEGHSFRVSMKDGHQFLYKIAIGENLGEHLHFALDRGLGMNNAPQVKIVNIGTDILEKHGISPLTVPGVGDNREFYGSVGAGHMMEWLDEKDGWRTAYDKEMGEAGKKPGAVQGVTISWEHINTPEKRATIWGTMLIDKLTRNYDRHAQNYLRNKDKGIAPIDSGFAGNFGAREEPMSNSGQIFEPTFSGPYGKSKLAAQQEEGMIFFDFNSGYQSGELYVDGTQNDLKKEVEDYWDAHMKPDVIDEIAEACNATIRGDIRDYNSEENRDTFVNHVLVFARKNVVFGSRP